MKRLKIFFALIISACLLFSCNGTPDTATAKDSSSSATVPAPESTSSNSTGDASYSYTIDGKISSGKGNADNLSAFKSGNGRVTFVLANMEPNQQGTPEQLSFFVADHGTTTMHNSNSTDNGIYSAKYSPSNYTDAFGFKEVKVIVTSSDATGIKGTFSGTLYDPQNKKEIPVTNGRFDLPWSPYSKK